MLKATLAVLAACVIATPSYAAEPANPLAKSSAILKLDGMDLGTAAGQRLLAIRMGHAAREVCGDRLATIHLALAAESRVCQAEVEADIRSQIEQRTAIAQSAPPAYTTPARVAISLR